MRPWRRPIPWPANLVGALITFAYFRFVDYGTTRARLDGDLPLRRLPAVKVKERTADVEVYALG